MVYTFSQIYIACDELQLWTGIMRDALIFKLPDDTSLLPALHNFLSSQLLWKEMETILYWILKTFHFFISF